MKQVSLILLILGSIAITSLMTACGSAGEPVSTTASDKPTAKSEVPRITVEELKKRLDDGEDILIIDTQTSRRQYEQQHVPGAIRSTGGFDDVAHDQAIVAYCT